MKFITLRFLALIIFVILSGSCYAGGPPWRTDDPIPVEYKHAEFYLFSNGISDNSGISGAGPAFEFNYGAFPNTQLHIVLPLAFDRPKIGAKHFGYGDTEVGVKYNLIHQSDEMPALPRRRGWPCDPHCRDQQRATVGTAVALQPLVAAEH